MDRHGRVATDLRVSLTDRCNLRCTYCMPAEGLDWLPSPELLTDDELVRLVGVAVVAGRDRGALHRRRAAAAPGAASIVERVAALRPRPALSLTTNGIGLTRLAAGRWPRPAWTGSTSRSTPWTRRPSPELTRRARIDDVLAGLAAAAAAGLTPVKVNAVLMRGVNDGEAPALLRWALRTATSCASSSRCRSTRSTAGAATT